jgi:DNA-binding MarR family transcriptional regulator
MYYIWYVSRTGSSVTTGNVGFLLAKASQRFNELLVARFAEQGFGEVRAAHGSVLVPLFERDGLRMLDLAAASRLSKQSMTALVKQCEEAGLVARRRDETDLRAFRIHLTARGRAFRRAAEEALAELDASLVQSLGTRDRDALVRALKGVMEL